MTSSRIEGDSYHFSGLRDFSLTMKDNIATVRVGGIVLEVFDVLEDVQGIQQKVTNQVSNDSRACFEWWKDHRDSS